MANSSRRWQYFGASVRGPAHIQASLPNQDAWLGARLRTGAAVVVCDGLGSRRHSRHGATEACRAAIMATRIWRKAAPPAPFKTLIPLIHAIWSLRVQPFDEHDCATTCLLAVADDDGSLHVAQLGDGLALVGDAGGVRVVGRVRDGFGNETTGLGIATRLSEWETYEGVPEESGSAVLLTTDGIADDLLPDRLHEFLRFIRAAFCPLPAPERWRLLAKELRNWPTPHHSDDKTLALLWSQSQEAQRA